MQEPYVTSLLPSVILTVLDINNGVWTCHYSSYTPTLAVTTLLLTFPLMHAP